RPLLKLVQAAYHTLNHTNSNVTRSCWLCYDIKPPFYEGIALNIPVNISNQDNPTQCKWGERQMGITLQQVKGQGVCIR
ncbi:ENV2 protein, partial [Trogon melanurus]|nr:ENV2 protein [Crotophaga sulcirostris]NXJ87274.1 ENV2 protein [Trogon melanurus]